MTRSLRVAASLWSVPPERLDAEVARLADSGVRLFHWDVTDGDFARSGGVDLATSRRLASAYDLEGEAHLMVRRPLEHLEAWVGHCRRIVVHVESEDWEQAVTRIVDLGAEAGLALSPGSADPATPRCPRLVMSVVPGEGGTPFRTDALDRIPTIAGRDEVGVDGGVDEHHGALAVRAGARWLVSGTSLVASPDPGQWLTRVAGPATTST